MNGDTLVLTFVGPTTDVYYPLLPQYPQVHFFGVDPLALNVYRLNGTWQTALMLTPEIEASADRLYRGGYDYPLTTAQADELTAAGFGAYIKEVS